MRQVSTILSDLPDVALLERLSVAARNKSVNNSSTITYSVGVRRFLSYLDLTTQSLSSLIADKCVAASILPYVTYLFVVENLSLSTIKTYVAGLQFFLFSRDYIDSSIWTPRLHQCLKGFKLQESSEIPLSQRFKLPITLSMIFWGRDNILKDCYNPFVKMSLFTALCVGFMFLFRKSEYLTEKNGRPKGIQGKSLSTLIASNTHFWFGDSACPAHGPFPITGFPDMMSIYLPFSKGDPYGKGATRFFPSDKTNPNCLVRLVYSYITQANLKPHHCLFAGPLFVVTTKMISQLIKLIAKGNGLPAHRFSPHSLRIGGLVTLFAAEVPENLKQ